MMGSSTPVVLKAGGRRGGGREGEGREGGEEGGRGREEEKEGGRGRGRSYILMDRVLIHICILGKCMENDADRI